MSNYEINQSWLIRALIVMNARDDYLRPFLKGVKLDEGEVDWKVIAKSFFSERDMEEEFFRLLSWAFSLYCDVTPTEEHVDNFPWLRKNIICDFGYVSDEGMNSIINAMKYAAMNTQERSKVNNMISEKVRRLLIGIA